MAIKVDIDLHVVSKLLVHSSVTVTQQRHGHLHTKIITESLEKIVNKVVEDASFELATLAV